MLPLPAWEDRTTDGQRGHHHRSGPTRARGVGRDEAGRVYFIKETAPGDVVNVQVLRKKSYFEAIVTDYVTLSTSTGHPFLCRSISAGMPFQHVSYALLIGGEAPGGRCLSPDRAHRAWRGPHQPGCPETVHYRNKLEFGFSCKKWLDPGGDASYLQ